MKKTAALLLSILFITGSIFAQKTNDDGGTDGNNDGTTPKDETENNTNPDTGDNTCMTTALGITSVLFGSYQSNLISSSNTNPSVTSLELLVHGGIANDATESFIATLPRVRLNYGALSGDIRYSFYTNENGSSAFLDAIANFNIIAGKAFKMSIGQGIMYTLDDSGQTYHESFIGMDLGLLDRSILISPEFRLAYDWDIKESVHTELSLRGGYRVFNTSKFAVYANIAAGYQMMQSDYTRTLIYGGLDIFIQ